MFTTIDSKLKFPHLKDGGTGIQVGFDMDYPVTSDLFTMCKRVGSGGKVIGIDPDPRNHESAKKIAAHKNLPIEFIQKGTFSKKDVVKLMMGEKSSWNQLDIVPEDTTVNITDERIDVEIDTLDAILKERQIDPKRVQHINLTINGSEFETLRGMTELFKQTEGLSLTVIAGRYDESGTVNGQPDYKIITEFLHQQGFTTRFKRAHQLFWWGFVAKLIMNRKWIYGKVNFGIVMACKKEHKLKWYQSFS